MKKSVFIGLISVVVVFAALAAVFPEEALARAGGGSASKGAGGIVGWLVAGIIAAVSAVVVYRKNRRCKALLAEISKIDKAWDPHALAARVEETYFKIQDAWKERDQDLARNYMSDRLYRKHKHQTDQMIKDGHKPMMFAINLKKATIVEITDFDDDSRDRFCALIEGSMIDYVVDEKTKAHVAGDPQDLGFREFWRFVREGDTWVLDEIDQKASMSGLVSMVAESEAVS